MEPERQRRSAVVVAAIEVLAPDRPRCGRVAAPPHAPHGVCGEEAER